MPQARDFRAPLGSRGAQERPASKGPVVLKAPMEKTDNQVFRAQKAYQDQLGGQACLGTPDRRAPVDCRGRRESKALMDGQGSQDLTEYQERKVNEVLSAPQELPLSSPSKA